MKSNKLDNLYNKSPVLVSIGLCIILNASAQLLLKHGEVVLAIKYQSWFLIAMSLITNAFIIGGAFVYICSMGLWLFVLSRVKVSIAYPLTSISYIINAIGAHYLLGESLSFRTILGILVIIYGVFLIARGNLSHSEIAG